MAALSGKSGAVTISAAEVNGIKNWSIDYKYNVANSTDFQSDGVSEFTSTVSEWSGSFDGDKDGAPVAMAGASVAATFKESETAGQVWSGNVIITGIASKTGYDGLVTYGYTFQGTGALTVATA